MQLIHVLLPLYDNDRQPIAHELFHQVRQELTDQFQGLTVYSRSPAEGLWKADGSQTTHDDLVLFEVMTDQLDRKWWSSYRQTLEQRFRQQKVVVRAQEVVLL